MSDPLTIELKDLSRLALKPNDVLVYSIDRVLCDEHREWLGKTFDQFLPGRKVIIVDGGAKLALLSPEITETEALAQLKKAKEYFIREFGQPYPEGGDEVFPWE